MVNYSLSKVKKRLGQFFKHYCSLLLMQLISGNVSEGLRHHQVYKKSWGEILDINLSFWKNMLIF